MESDEQWLSYSYDNNGFATVGIILVCNLRRTEVVEHIIKDFQLYKLEASYSIKLFFIKHIKDEYIFSSD